MEISEIQKERFWNKVSKDGPTQPHMDTPCWEWQGGRNNYNYGITWLAGKTMGAHKAADIITNGDIPDGIQSLHKCDNPPCCNPEHLFRGTQADNIKDARNKKRMWSQSGNGIIAYTRRTQPPSDSTIEIIRFIDSHPHLKLSEIARTFNKSRQRIHQIKVNSHKYKEFL